MVYIFNSVCRNKVNTVLYILLLFLHALVISGGNFSVEPGVLYFFTFPSNPFIKYNGINRCIHVTMLNAYSLHDSVKSLPRI